MNASTATRHKLVIAVDGPSGSGKSSVSREAANRLDFNFLDTGAMYRMITFYLDSKKVVNQEDIEQIFLTEQIELEVSINPSKILFEINGKDISTTIRNQEITSKVSHYASIQTVRDFLLLKQRSIINDSLKGIVVEGRDIGSVVVPQADLKIFITASEEVRAQRRAKEINLDPNQVLKDQKIRDEKDSNRKISPLIIPEDAVILDTSSLNFEESVNEFIKLVKNV